MPAAPHLSVDQIREVLREVIDPEVGINIVDLGLIYKIDSTPEQITIEMTMTSPACPMGPYIQDDVEHTLQELAGDSTRIKVDVVWDPPWSPEQMSDWAKAHLGA